MPLVNTTLAEGAVTRKQTHDMAARPTRYGRCLRVMCLRMTTVATKRQQPIRSTIPARLDRLRWSPFHTRLVLGLGTAWMLDGLEITIASSVTSKLTQANTLNLSTAKAAASPVPSLGGSPPS